ncbi:MAG: uracil phosphoribosyltransferase [Chitinivorax sp.]
MAVYEQRHPLIQHKIGLLRASKTGTKQCRELVAEIARLLTYEATRDLPLEPATVEAWCGNVEVEQLQGRKLTVVPILRAGLGMLDGVLDVIPCAKISVIGMSRNEATLEPRLYVSKLVPHIEQRRALLVDPMLATGGSLFAAIRLLKQAGCQHIRAMVLVAAPDAIARLEQQYPDVDVYTAVIDSHLDANGFIVPGLGDAGDRIMGSVES